MSATKSLWEQIKETGVVFGLLFGWTGYHRMAKFFKDSEVEGLDPQLVAMLDVARGAAGVQFIITSGWREPEHNAAVGGVKNSSHERGLAVDLRARNDQIGKLVAFGLGRAGFKQFIAYTDHIHVSTDEQKGEFAYDGGESH